jgi:hypothetical protein
LATVYGCAESPFCEWWRVFDPRFDTSRQPRKGFDQELEDGPGEVR